MRKSLGQVRVCSSELNRTKQVPSKKLTLRCFTLGFPGGTLIKSPPANAGDAEDTGSIPGSGRSPGGGNDNPLQDSGLENPMREEPAGLQSTGLQEFDTPE